MNSQIKYLAIGFAITILAAVIVSTIVGFLLSSTPVESSTISTVPQSTCDTREYYVKIIINDENGIDTTPFVNIKDPDGQQVFFGRTDENGTITIPLCSLTKYNVTIMKEKPCSILVYPRENEYRMVCK